MARFTPLRIVVGSSDCDALGHMNVANYYSYSSLSGREFQRLIGWPPGQANKGRRLSFAVVRAESDFRAEVLEGQAILVTTSVGSIGEKSATFLHQIALEDGTEVYSSVWRSVLMNLDTRRSEYIPDDLRQALQAHLVDDPDLAL